MYVIQMTILKTRHAADILDSIIYDLSKFRGTVSLGQPSLSLGDISMRKIKKLPERPRDGRIIIFQQISPLHISPRFRQRSGPSGHSAELKEEKKREQLPGPPSVWYPGGFFFLPFFFFWPLLICEHFAAWPTVQNFEIHLRLLQSNVAKSH